MWRFPRKACVSFIVPLAGFLAWGFPFPVEAGQSSRAIANSTRDLVDRGLELYRIGDFPGAIEIWMEALQHPLSPGDLTIVYSNLATAYQRLGRVEEAVAYWEQVLEFYRDRADSDRYIGPILTEQAQAYDSMGQHQRAIRLLEEALARSIGMGDRATEAAAYGGLGNSYWALGRYEEAIAAHNEALEIARELDLDTFAATASNNLGNVYTSRIRRHRYQAKVARSEGEFDEEARLNAAIEADIDRLLDVVRQSVETARDVGGITQVRALLNFDRVLQEFGDPEPSELTALHNQIRALLSAEPNSRDKVFATIDFAVNLTDDLVLKAYLLERAIQISRDIGDRRAESFGLGALGRVYEQNRQYDIALDLTRQAQFAAQQVNASDSLYRWQWQAGRIYKVMSQSSEALVAYRNAIATLQSIRSDIIATSQDVQFDFRDSVEPVYRETIDLLLNPNTPGERQQKLEEVLEVLELLKLAELQNFFGDECVEVARSIVAEDGQLADANAVVVYTIILNDRTAIVLQKADGTLFDRSVAISAEVLQEEVDRFRSLLEKRGTNEYLVESTRLYDLLIRPIQSELAQINPQTLVFVQDGVLRKTPVAALHDGKQFLVEKYALATTPSLTLTTASSNEVERTNALIVGLTVEVPPFAALNNVAREVERVKEIVGGTALLDEAFTVENFEAELNDNSYSIVHMATHGQFGVDADSTFLLAYDDRITIEEIDRLLRSRRISSSGRRTPLDLLVLSACQTAAGDNRAALGIAGVAVRAGAKSALASLWFINDESTVPLVEEFYRQLEKPGITKAEALRQAQLKAINSLENNHPGVWSPFLIIGSWL